MNEELDLIEAGTGHVTLVGCDEVAEVMEAGGWWALCESAATISPASPRTTSSWGYFQTEAEAKGGGLGTDRGPDWRGEVAHIAGYVRVFEPTLGWCGGRYVLSGGCERHVEGLGDDVSSLKA
jgi:hypothetical protein